MIAWHQLVGVGFAFANNPANSFFYLLTGLHGAHLLGGSVALAYVVFAAWGGETAAELVPKVDLCALYWHFLLVVWGVMILVMLGWTYDPFLEFCRNLNIYRVTGYD